MTRIVGITFTFTAALDSCSMTASTGASNLYLKEPAWIIQCGASR